MPCLVLGETPKSHTRIERDNGPTTCTSEEPSWLYCQLDQGANLLIIDCRPFSEYCQAHIEGAINLQISDLVLRRLRKGNISLSTLLNSDASKEKFQRRAQFERIIICDSNSKRDNLQNNVLKFLISKLSEDCRVCFLEGGFSRFEECYPHLCQCGEGNEIGKTLFSISALKITDSNDSNNNNNPCFKLPQYPQMRKEPCRYRPESSGPIEIIPHLFLGNKKDSVDRKCLEDHKIRYVLNVTHDLPNEFENETSFNYLKLPVEDNWEGNLISLFPQAFAFIEQARDSEENVLVHCVGGVSRSSTIVIAYLMLKHSYSLNDAYDFVKAKKSNISPNFNFMQQLLDLERTRVSFRTPSGSEVGTSSPYSVKSEASDYSSKSC
eukprot:gene2428-18082_t